MAVVELPRTHPVHTNCPGLFTGAPLKSPVTPLRQMSYFQVHLKILLTSGTVQSPNSIILDLAQWSCACFSFPPQGRSLLHFHVALQWSSGALDNSSGTKLSHQLQVCFLASYSTCYGGLLAEGLAKQQQNWVEQHYQIPPASFPRQPLNWQPMQSLVWVIISLSAVQPMKICSKSTKKYVLNPPDWQHSRIMRTIIFPFTSSPPHLVARWHWQQPPFVSSNLVYSCLVQCCLTSGTPEESNSPADGFMVWPFETAYWFRIHSHPELPWGGKRSFMLWVYFAFPLQHIKAGI